MNRLATLKHNGTSHGIRLATFVWVMGGLAELMSTPASSQPFRPLRALNTWYTDRRVVDIEVVGDRSQPGAEQVSTSLPVLRLRLERAYITLLTQGSGSATRSVSLAFDLPTGLPSSLFQAPVQEVEKRGDPVEHVNPQEYARRTINLVVDGASLADRSKEISAELDACKGDRIHDGLFEFDGTRNRSCHTRSLGFGDKYIAQLSDGLVLIQCSEAPIGCATSIPIDGFSLSVGFSRHNLENWGSVVSRVNEFVQSKKLRD
jgi:hypothetical protein